jgi:hypothetical protein
MPTSFVALLVVTLMLASVNPLVALFMMYIRIYCWRLFTCLGDSF